MTRASAYDWDAAFARIDAENKAAGRCLMCGGGGVVADMPRIERTGDPHANKRCPRCKGDGKYRERKSVSQTGRTEP